MFKSIPHQRVISKAVEYTIPNAAYYYRMNYDERTGYTLQRRLAPSDESNYFFWSRGMEVENYIQLKDGQWDPSWHARPIMKFEKPWDVEKLIALDCENPKPSLRVV